MGRSQISLFVILGICILIIIGYFALSYNSSSGGSISKDYSSALSTSFNKDSLETNIGLCIQDAVEESFLDTGLRESTLPSFRELVKSKTEGCSIPLFEQLKKQNVEVSAEPIDLSVKLYEETLVVDMVYPISARQGDNKIDLAEFHKTFKRSVTEEISSGETKMDTSLISNNGKAHLTIPKGTSMTAASGGQVSEIGVKVEDIHFDGLENKYAVGQVAYDFYPEGLTFSKPVELAIEIRDQDIPPGYTRDNLRISYWNDKVGTWYAYPTTIINNSAVANVTHFSKWAINVVQPFLVENHIFEPRFFPAGASADESEAKGNSVWAISGRNGQSTGTVSLQPGYDLEDTKKNFLQQNGGFADNRKIYNDKRSQFLSFPDVKYGYFKNPDSPSDKEFVDCEHQDTSSASGDLFGQGMIYGLDSQGFPYFVVDGCRSYSCSADKACPLNADPTNLDPANADNKCLGKRYCNGIGDGNKVCLPYQEGKGLIYSFSTKTQVDGGLPCCAEEKKIDPSNIPEEDKVFGWHNFQCAGGMVRPLEGDLASDMIILEPNGNSVIQISDSYHYDHPDITVHQKPPKNWKEGTALEDIPLLFKLLTSDDPNRGIIDSIKEEDLMPSYCNIAPFPGTQDLIQQFDFSKLSPETQSRVKAAFSMDNPNLKVPVFGIYGLDIIKRVDNPKAKSEIHAQCWVYWTFWGNGYTTSTPFTYSAKDILGEKAKAGGSFAQQFLESLKNKVAPK